jgi:hypothetical protein
MLFVSAPEKHLHQHVSGEVSTLFLGCEPKGCLERELHPWSTQPGLQLCLAEASPQLPSSAQANAGCALPTSVRSSPVALTWTNKTLWPLHLRNNSN